ncbi:hypothetical protein ACQEVZ_35020 [Dactylosporangium sp. CA-152071]
MHYRPTAVGALVALCRRRRPPRHAAPARVTIVTGMLWLFPAVIRGLGARHDHRRAATAGDERHDIQDLVRGIFRAVR